MARKSTVKVTVKKTSGKKPVKPTLGTGVSGGLLHTQIKAYVKKKKGTTNTTNKQNG